MKIRIVFPLLLLPALLLAQDEFPPQPKKLGERTAKYVPEPTPFSEGITAADIKILVDSLAGKTFAGRETGTEGQRLAADYIAEQFAALKLPSVGDDGPYFQKILLQKDSWEKLSIVAEGKTFRERTDFYVFSAQCPDVKELKIKEIQFVGYGIDDPKYSDYGKANVKGKAVAFYAGEPMDNEGKSLITGEKQRSNWSMDWKKKVQLAESKGATLAIFIDPEFSETLSKNRRSLSNRGGWTPVSDGKFSKEKPFGIPHIFVSPETFNAICGGKAEKVADELNDLKSREKFKPVKIKTNALMTFDKESSRLEGSNVIAFIEGSDPKLKKEYVMVTAHYDHLGAVDSTKIYYGADDNASGTAGVIEIARAMAEAKAKGTGPRRSVVCMLVSGEEKGLLGSKYYTEFPVFPLKQTVVDINIDMIGRVDKAHANDPNYIYVIGGDRTSHDLHSITEEMNEIYTKLALDYKYNVPDEPNSYFTRSDHYNFVLKGIPATFFFNGTHEDYHKATDTADKINFDAAAKRAQLAFIVAWEIANRDHRVYPNFTPESLKK